MRCIAIITIFISLSFLCSSDPIENRKRVMEFQVVTVDQQPIKGAEVELVWPYKESEDTKDSRKSFLKTATDEKGWFRFEIDNYVTKPDYYLILVRKRGYSLGWKDIFSNKDPITLYPLSRFSGKVVETTGQPVPDAQVRLLYLFKETTDYGQYTGGITLGPSYILEFMSVQTKDDGSFQFDLFPEGSDIEMSISKEGYATYNTYQLSEETYQYDAPPSRLTGQVFKIPYRKRVGPK